jgi:hypothetical protein
MRLERELGSLSREIIAIKEKWKIALNINSKKVAIERLITRRKSLRNSNNVNKTIEEATKNEEDFLESQGIPVERPKEKPQFGFEEVLEKDVFDPLPKKEINKEELKEKIQPHQNTKKLEIKTEEEKPAHLTVNWLKNRLKK